jgi:tetratricopeptide (TPR) repeat protein
MLRVMNIPVRRVSSGVVLLALFFLFSGCNTNKNAEETTELLYRQAYTSSSSRDYLKALDFFNKALTLDTLKGVTPRVVRGLFEKRFIEGLTGKYDEAFRSSMRLEKLPTDVLPDSLRNIVLSDKATWLHELGNPGAAAASLEKVVSPSPELRFKLASFYQESGDFSKAAMIYRNFSGRELDPVTRMKAYAGLLECKIAQPQLAIEEADALAGKIAAESGRVLAIKGNLIPRIQALRAASRSLLLLEKHRRNASYLLFRALILAEESGNQFLLQVLRLESNAAIVRKADTFREVADYFRTRNMQYAQAASLFMLAGSKSLEADERIAALQEGFSISRDYAPPYPTSGLLQLEKSSGRRLTGLLMEKSRIFELFDAGEKIGMIDLHRTLQRYPGSIKLGKGHEALEAEARRLHYEISGLLQRKTDIFILAEGDEKSRPVDQALNIKRGKMMELLLDVRAVNPVAAEAMQLLPVTLRTVQGALKDDEVILKPLLSDSLCGVMLISKRQLQIAGSALSFDSLHTPESGIRALRSELASADSGTQRSGSEQEWFDTAFYEPLAGSLNGFRHLVVIADDLFPFHLLGSSHFSIPQQRYSFLQSIKEFVLLSETSGQQPASSQVYFYRVENISGARIHKLFFPSDRVFLLWKNYSGVELEAFRQQIGKEMQGTVSGSAALFVLGKASDAGREIWKYISSYGVE